MSQPKRSRKLPYKHNLPKVGDAILFHNHQKTGFAPTFLPGYRVVKKIDDSNYLIKHVITGQTSQVHLKDLIVSPMIRQVFTTSLLWKHLVDMANMLIVPRWPSRIRLGEGRGWIGLTRIIRINRTDKDN